MRTTAFSALLASLLFALLAGLGGDAARAQRSGAAQSNNTTSKQGQKTDQPKRVFVGRGSDTGTGSRVTIKSDNPLNDYSAYRSGDRFYVVLPRAAAGSVAKGGSGKGYTDMQVQQRGNDVVLSYRVQPGAKPRVEQKFNRLDVVFDAPEGGQSNAASNGGANQSQSQAENRNPAASAQPSNQNPSASANPSANAERRTQTQNEASVQTNAAAPSVNTQAGATNTAQQPQGVEQGAQNPAGQPAAAETPEAAPSSTQQAEPQLAQAQPPTSVAPITKANNPSETQTGATLGTYLLQNWWIALVAVLVVAGFGLIIAARRSSTPPPVLLEGEGVSATTLDSADRLKAETVSADLKAGGVKTPSVPSALTGGAVAAASVVAAGVAPKKADKKAKKKAKRKAGRDARKFTAAESAEAVATPVEETDATSAVAPPVEEVTAAPIEETAATPLVAEPVVAEPVSTVTEEPASEAKTDVEGAVAEEKVFAGEPVAQETVSEDASVAEAPSTELASPANELASATTIEPVAPTAEEPATGAASSKVIGEVAEAGVAGAVLAGLAAETSRATDEPAATSQTLDEAALVGVEASAKGITPDVALDPDNAQAEARRLLEGGEYDHAVVGSSDSMARQIVASELLSALSGRNAERRERARSAFIEHGYYDDTLRDLHLAAAPAERAAAARSLAIVGDRGATTHLVAALEDDSADVRRASVEALGSLRDPAAIRPLEALAEAERQRRGGMPVRVIRHAVEACREAAAESRAQSLAPAAEAASHAVAEPPAESRVAETPFETAPAVETEATPAPLESATVGNVPAEDATKEVLPFTESSAVTPSERSVEPVQDAVEFASVEELVAGEETVSHVAETHAVTEIEHVESNVFSIEPLVVEPHAAEQQAEEEAQHVEEPGAAFADSHTHAGAELAGLVLEQEQSAASDEASIEPSTLEIIHSPAAIAEDRAAKNEGVSTSEREDSADDWVEFDMDEMGSAQKTTAVEPAAPLFESSSGDALHSADALYEAGSALEEPSTDEPATREIETSFGHVGLVDEEETQAVEARDETHEKGVVPFDEFSTVPASIQQRIASQDARERAAAITELSHVDTDEAFQQICSAFDDEAKEVRSAAARALYELRTDRADSFTRALREASPERRRQIGASIAGSGLAGEAISQLTGESREKTYEAFSLLFLMAKAGEVQPLIRAIEGHPNNEVRLAVVKLLALSGQKEILPAFRRLAVRGSLPTEVRSAVMEAIYQISSSSQPSTSSAA